MKITRRQLRRMIRESVFSDTYQSHTFEPSVGDSVVNVNPNCKHVGSEGTVVSIEDLPGDAGKTVAYRCTNTGKSWEEGDVLNKTMDQLSPLATAGLSW